MDLERPPSDEIARLLRFLRFVNRWLGGRRAVLSCLGRLELPPRPLILDVATGAADIPEAVAQRWPEARVVAIDINPEVLACARAVRGVHLVRADARRMPFRSVDVVICSEFFHHLTHEQAVAMLSAFGRIARHGVVINDLLRWRRAYLWIRFFVLFSSSRLAKADGPLSVRRGFSLDEVARLREAAGGGTLKATVHFGHRFCLWGRPC